MHGMASVISMASGVQHSQIYLYTFEPTLGTKIMQILLRHNEIKLNCNANYDQKQINNSQS